MWFEFRAYAKSKAVSLHRPPCWPINPPDSISSGEVTGDQFSAKATDLETWVIQTTKVVQVTKPGTALVDASRLQSVVKEVVADTIVLESDGDHLVVRAASAKFRLLAMKPSDFPPFPEAEQAQPFTIKAKTLRKLVLQTAFSASKENSQYARAAILFRVQGGRLELVATDSRRLARAGCDVGTAVEASSMIPTKNAEMLDPMLADAGPDDVVTVRLGERQAFFEADGTTICTGLMHGEFPQHEGIVPAETPHRITANAEPPRLAAGGEVRADPG